jgi:hypothetical protein
MVNEQLEAARVAWLEAEQRAEQYAQDDREKAAKWRAAIAHRESIPTRIVAGEVLHKSDLTQAKVVEADAKNNSTMAEAVARAARKRADEAHMAYLQEAAEDIGERYRAAEQSVFVDSVELDYQVSRAREQAEKVRRSETHRAAIAEEARQHNLSLESLVNGGQRVQPILSKLHNSEWPKTRLPRHATAHEMPRLRVELVVPQQGFHGQAAGIFDKVVLQTAEEFVVAHGITPPEVQQEPADEEPAEQFAVAAE